MTKPAIAVIIPAFNIENYIGDALASVIAQSFSDWECIVVDDGSRDGTAARIEAFTDSRIRLIRQRNAGVSAARNAGVASSSADAVIYLDGDDQLHPTALERLHAALTAEPSAVLVYGAHLRTLANGEIEPGQKPPETLRYTSGELLEGMITRRQVFWNGGQILVRAHAVRASGGYDPSLRLSEDWEYFCRLTALGPCIYIGPQEEILRHRIRPDSTVPELGMRFENQQAAIEKLFGNAVIASRFTPARWKALRNEVIADQMFEVGRQRFTQKQFGPSRKLMLQSLLRRPTVRRLAIFAFAQVSQLLNRPLLNILRFNVK